MNKKQRLSTASIDFEAAKLNTVENGKVAMEILVRADGVALNHRLREAVLQKIGRARQYAPQALRARVQLHKVCAKASPDQYRAHVLYEVRGNDVSAEHTAHDPVVALDLVAKKIKRRLRRRKTATLARRLRWQRIHVPLRESLNQF